MVAIHVLLESAFADLQTASNADQWNLFEQHSLNHGFGIIANSSPLWVFDALPTTVSTFVILIAVASRTILVAVIRATGRTSE